MYYPSLWLEELREATETSQARIVEVVRSVNA
jgi:hypothetical protein